MLEHVREEGHVVWHVVTPLHLHRFTGEQAMCQACVQQHHTHPQPEPGTAPHGEQLLCLTVLYKTKLAQAFNMDTTEGECWLVFGQKVWPYPWRQAAPQLCDHSNTREPETQIHKTQVRKLQNGESKRQRFHFPTPQYPVWHVNKQPFSEKAICTSMYETNVKFGRL